MMYEQEQDTNQSETMVEKPETVASQEQALSSCKDQLVRISADFDNYRRRTEREKIEWTILAKSSAIKHFLGIADDVARALEHAQREQVAQTVIQGLELIKKNFDKALKELHVEPIEAEGKFDPNHHEALVSVDSPDHTAGHIVQVFEKGYKIAGSVVRFAKVSIAK